MTTACLADGATCAHRLPPNLRSMSDGALYKLARVVYPRNNSVTQVFHKLLCSWKRAAYIDRCKTRWLVHTVEEFQEGAEYSRGTIYAALRQFELDGLIVKRHAPHPYRKSDSRRHCNWIAVRYPAEDGYSPRVCAKGECTCMKDYVSPQQEGKHTARDERERTGEMPPALKRFYGLKDQKLVDHTRPTKNRSIILPIQENPSDKNSSPADAGAGELSNSGKRFQGHSSPEDFREAPAMTSKLGSKTLAEIMADRAVKTKAEAEAKKDQVLKAVEALRIVQSARRQNWPHEPPMGISGKDNALMKQFLAKMRELGFTDQQIRTALREVVLGWDGFCSQVKNRTGRKLPERPQIITFTWQFDEVVVYIREGGFTEPTTDASMPAGPSMADLFGKK